MTLPSFSVLHGGDPAPAPASAQEGTAQLHQAGPVQVHVHLGYPSPPIGQAGPAALRRHPVLAILLGLAMAGGGYLAGLRNVGTLSHPDPARAVLSEALPMPPNVPLPVPDAAPLPLPPARSGDMPPALQQQLARPPVVTPPPGGSPAARARNPFGLGD